MEREARPELYVNSIGQAPESHWTIYMTVN